MNTIAPAHFDELFLRNTPLIDVRAPIEFREGSMPGAVNLPLLTDVERHEVGSTYKNQGQQAAVDLGHALVGGSVREARIQDWLAEIQRHPDAVIFCFRGGLRSQIVQAWLKEQGVERPIVQGGYKALRRHLLQTTIERTRELQFQVVCGPTGSGKTTFLSESGKPYLDLEALARHRGSAFGGTACEQPSQIDFENAIAVNLMRLSGCREPVLVENESRMIGRCCLPEALFLKMKESPKLIHEVSLDQRVENIFQEYVVNTSLGREANVGKFQEFRQAVNAISKRLGGLRAQEVLADLDFSQREFENNSGLESCRVWIRKLLEWYYDPLYKRDPEAQISQKLRSK